MQTIPMNMIPSTPVVRVRGAFRSQEPASLAWATANKEGTVRVFDSVAGHWTVCHSLTNRQEARVRRLCREAAEAAWLA